MTEVEAELKGHKDIVVSVAFAQDDGQVVSGSLDNTVRIWNTVTGKTQLLTTTSITLPDVSIVHRAGGTSFHISYPEQPTLSTHGPLSISDDCQWIVGALHDCWIPSHIRNFISSSFSGDRMCLGYDAGNVIIFQYFAVPPRVHMDSTGLYPKCSQVVLDWSPLHSSPLHSSPLHYSDVIYHATPFFKLSLKM